MNEKIAFFDQSCEVNKATKQNLPVQLIQQRGLVRGLVRDAIFRHLVEEKVMDMEASDNFK